jgi:hypothetical protein
MAHLCISSVAEQYKKALSLGWQDLRGDSWNGVCTYLRIELHIRPRKNKGGGVNTYSKH